MIQKKIKSINFALLSPDIIRKMSSVRIVTPDTYYDDGFPIEGGLMDLRLGVINPGLRCKTCGGRMTSCTGHFGSIELVRPVIHIGYVKMILTLLKTTCRKCGRVLLSPENIQEYKELMLKAEGEEQEDRTIEIIAKSKKATKCPHCKTSQDKIKLLRPTTFYEGDQRLFPSQIRERVERIPERDLELLGININAARPEWSVLTVLPVSPVTTRPSITLETGERSEDDLTHKMVDVLRINQRLADNISAGAPQLIIEDLWDLLQYHTNTYFNNEVSGIPPARHRSGRPLKTLFQRLKGKEGRFRYNLSGKRVNFSARTVISPDPSLSVSEVGVPQQIAEELTTPQYVTEWNIKGIKKMIKNNKYPRILYVIRPDGTRKKITELNKSEIIDEIQTGYEVERQLIDGDIALFNRQPSLHRVSIMAHKVRVLPGKTFRINDAVALPYNADYDGDEMNLHIPQTEEARTEAEHLMRVENHILSVRHGKPLVSGSHDHITGTYFLTKDSTFFDEETVAYLLGGIGINELPGKTKDGMYRGRDIFSILIPDNISFKRRSKMHRKHGGCTEETCPDAFVVVEKGKLLRGAIDSDSLKEGLIEKIFKQNGPKAARIFIDQMTKLSLEVLMHLGYTVSLDEFVLSDEVRKMIKKTMKDTKKNVDKMIDEYKKGELKRIPGKTLEETLEDMIMGELTKSWKMCGRTAEKDLGDDNFAVLMGRVGARGSIINVAQMSACIGQTALRGKRILRGYRKKALPYFKEGDISAEARGFITSSFDMGLTPIEYFFHSMSGRDSLVDKGINTARSGYMQRRLINALLDVSLQPDLSARDSAGMIVQFKYGDDGVNPLFCKNDKDVVDIEKYIK